MKAAVSGLAFAISLLASPVFAGLEICNSSGRSLSIAVGYAEGKSWISKGWWNIDHGDCQEPVRGDLQNRYYYYLATDAGAPFASGDYAFCTTPDVFTIHGDENCAARGYDSTGFRQLDTGETARHFPLTLVDDAAAPPPATPPGTAEPADRATPGTHGEPYADAAIMQGCSYEGQRVCNFHASGTAFYVTEDWRTPSALFDLMQQLSPGTPIFVDGDIVDFYDRTADVVLRNVTTRPWTINDNILNTLQGTWYSVDDPSARFNVLGAELDNSYDDQFTSREYIAIWDSCGTFEGGGPYLWTLEEETGDTACYAIEQITDLELELMYLPRGNILRYRSLD
ncbi:MAG: DUF1036 domain-containing protein [Rhodobacteraceae bacterium]|nr:DUF1036 domain-containing protein [Paracoccaceae bacterium]